MDDMRFPWSKSFDLPSSTASSLLYRPVFLWAYNILTLGIPTVRSTVIHERQIKLLQSDQKNLISQIVLLEQGWDNLGGALNNLLKLIENDDFDGELIQAKLDAVNLNKKILEENSHLNKTVNCAWKTSEIARDVISFVGKWIVNGLTLGLHGVYQNRLLMFRTKALNDENQFLRENIKQRSNRKIKSFEKVIEGVNGIILKKKKGKQLKKNIDEIQLSNPEKMNEEAENFITEFQSRKRELEQLQKDFENELAVEVSMGLSRNIDYNNAQNQLEMKKIEFNKVNGRSEKLKAELQELCAANDALKKYNKQLIDIMKKVPI